MQSTTRQSVAPECRSRKECSLIPTKLARSRGSETSTFSYQNLLRESESLVEILTAKLSSQNMAVEESKRQVQSLERDHAAESSQLSHRTEALGAADNENEHA